jgi:hypothetical protein
MGSEVNHEVSYGKPVLKIKLEKNEFFQGEMVKGIIKLKSSNLLKNGVIKYYIINKECYFYKEQNNIDDNDNKKQTIFVTSLTYPQLIDYSLSSGINIPFSLNLPNEILPNFEYSVVKGNGYIRNFIQIEIPELNVSSQVIILVKKPYKTLKSPLSFYISQKQSLLGIINRGNLLLCASYKTNCYCFFSKIPLKINIKNNSNNNIDINKLNIQLIRKIIFKNNKNNDDKKDIEFNDILFSNELNIYKNLDNVNNDYELSTEIFLEEPESLFNKYRIEPTTYNFLNIMDKQNLIKLIPDVNSHLFNCEYKIKITCIYNQMLKTENICLFMPLSVCHQESKNNIQNINGTILNRKINDLAEKEEKENKDNNKTQKKIFEEKMDKKDKIKEPGNDDLNTPTNDILNPRVDKFS